ncbi:MAG: galactokinase [Planctomycetia bacterium]|nr:galactokinase [Planctomycetia bacterium]
MIELDYQGDPADTAALADRLAGAGFADAAAAERASLVAKAVAGLRGSPRPKAFLVPGRIEVLGKHTDYAGGRTMVFATERGFAVVASPRDDRRVTITATADGQRIEFPLDAELAPRAGHWSNYPMTVARRIARNFPGELRGADLAFASDLPSAAGMSSSSAMMVGVFLALAEVNGLARRPEYLANIRSTTDLAGYLGTIENGQTFGTLPGDRGVGTFGGSEDHTAMLEGRPGRVSQYSYCPVRFERAVALPPGLWREHAGGDEPHLAAVLAGSPDALATLTAIVATSEREDFNAASLASRLSHFVAESEQIVPAAGDALVVGDLTAFGRLVDRSQEIAERLLGNQVPETCHLAAIARECGAAAACGFGAGFGGSVWALVATDDVEPFLASWAGRYHAAYPRLAATSRFFATTAGPAAVRVCR